MTIEHILVFLICIIGFAEAILMALVDWEDLPISVRKSPRKLYNVLKDEFDLREWSELSVIERRSMKRKYTMLCDYLMLPSWEELSIIDKRSHKRLYKVIKSVYDRDFGDSDPSLEGPPIVKLPNNEPLEEAE